jgi:hypothetical protein
VASYIARPLFHSCKLRGREAVRADRRLRTDEKHIRTQSAISDKSNPKPSLRLSITVFSVRMRFSFARKTRLARAARKSVGGKYSKRPI